MDVQAARCRPPRVPRHLTNVLFDFGAVRRCDEGKLSNWGARVAGDRHRHLATPGFRKRRGVRVLRRFRRHFGGGGGNRIAAHSIITARIRTTESFSAGRTRRAHVRRDVLVCATQNGVARRVLAGVIVAGAIGGSRGAGDARAVHDVLIRLARRVLVELTRRIITRGVAARKRGEARIARYARVILHALIGEALNSFARCRRAAGVGAGGAGHPRVARYTRVILVDAFVCRAKRRRTRRVVAVRERARRRRRSRSARRARIFRHVLIRDAHDGVACGIIAACIVLSVVRRPSFARYAFIA